MAVEVEKIKKHFRPLAVGSALVLRCLATVKHAENIHKTNKINSFIILIAKVVDF